MHPILEASPLDGGLVSGVEATPTNGPPAGDWLGTPFLRLERRGPIAWCTVDRPERRNAMTPAMYFGARRAVDVLNSDDSLTALVLTGVGDVFIPGGDLGGAPEEERFELGEQLYLDVTPFRAIRDSSKPVIAAVNGLCQGGGLLMAMLADVAVASERATFRAPELFRGIADMGYAAWLPAQIGPARARDMLLTGRVLDAPTAESWGLVTRVVSHDELEAEALEVARRTTWAAPDARDAVKSRVNHGYGDFDQRAMRASLASDECAEGWQAFAERRAPSWIPPELAPDGRI